MVDQAAETPQPSLTTLEGAGGVPTIDELSGSLSEVYGRPDYLTELRADWPT
jgi:hypothetical protein